MSCLTRSPSKVLAGCGAAMNARGQQGIGKFCVIVCSFDWRMHKNTFRQFICQLLFVLMVVLFGLLGK